MVHTGCSSRPTNYHIHSRRGTTPTLESYLFAAFYIYPGIMAYKATEGTLYRPIILSDRDWRAVDADELLYNCRQDLLLEGVKEESHLSNCFRSTRESRNCQKCYG